MVTEALGEVVNLDHLVAKPLVGRNLDLQLAVPSVGLSGLGHEAVVGGQPGLALGLAGLWSHAHPIKLTVQRAPTCRVGLLLGVQTGPLLFQPTGVVALVRDAPAVVQFKDPAGHVVEEVPIVRDGDHRAGVIAQRSLQPCHRLGVEVVGGLVQQQQLGSGQQQPTQGHTPTLAA